MQTGPVFSSRGSISCQRSAPCASRSNKVSLPVPPRQPVGSFAAPMISEDLSGSVVLGGASRSAGGAHAKRFPLSSAESGIPQMVPSSARNKPSMSPVPCWSGVGAFATEIRRPNVFSTSATGTRGASGRRSAERHATGRSSAIQARWIAGLVFEISRLIAFETKILR
jgi:hypothetical protein